MQREIRKIQFFLIQTLSLVFFQTDPIKALEYLVTERGDRLSVSDSSQNRDLILLLQSIPNGDSSRDRGFNLEDSTESQDGSLLFEKYIHSKILADLNSISNESKVKSVSLKWNVQNLRVFHPVEKNKYTTARLLEPGSSESFILPDGHHGYKWNRNSASINYFFSVFMLVTSLAVVSCLSGRK